VTNDVDQFRDIRAKIIKEFIADCMTLPSHITPAPTNTHYNKRA
jgi:hypothetical protein